MPVTTENPILKGLYVNVPENNSAYVYITDPPTRAYALAFEWQTRPAYKEFELTAGVFIRVELSKVYESVLERSDCVVQEP